MKSPSVRRCAPRLYNNVPRFHNGAGSLGGGQAFNLVDKTYAFERKIQ